MIKNFSLNWMEDFWEYMFVMEDFEVKDLNIFFLRIVFFVVFFFIFVFLRRIILIFLCLFIVGLKFRIKNNIVCNDVVL